MKYKGTITGRVYHNKPCAYTVYNILPVAIWQYHKDIGTDIFYKDDSGVFKILSIVHDVIDVEKVNIEE